MKIFPFLSGYCSFSVSTGPNVLDFYRGFIRYTFQIKLPALHDKLNFQTLYLERIGQQISKNIYLLRIFKLQESLCQEIGIITKVSLQLYHRILMFGLRLWDLLLSTLLFIIRAVIIYLLALGFLPFWLSRLITILESGHSFLSIIILERLCGYSGCIRFHIPLC